jgi:hypothetical protein
VGQTLEAHSAPTGAHPVRLTIAQRAPGTAVARTTRVRTTAPHQVRTAAGPLSHAPLTTA